MGFRMLCAKVIIVIIALLNGTLISFLAVKWSDDLEMIKELIKELIWPDTQEEEEEEFIDIDNDDEITELEKRFGPIRLTPKK